MDVGRRRGHRRLLSHEGEQSWLSGVVDRLVFLDVLHHGLDNLRVRAGFHIGEDALVLSNVEHVVVDVDNRRILAET